MILKNLRHRIRLHIAIFKLMWRYDVLIEKGVTAKYIDSIRFGTHCTINSGAYLYGSRRGNPVVFGDNVVLSAQAMVYGEGGVDIGSGTHLGVGVVLTTQFGDTRSDMTAAEPVVKSVAVKIGRACWIGSGAILMPGTVLGDRCIVAPNSVVFGVWGDDVKLAGNPARRVKR